MVNSDYYIDVGYALELLAQSEYHKNSNMMTYFNNEILPPINAGQVEFYISAQGVPIGMATWAWLSTDLRNEVHKTGRTIVGEEWNSGNHLFFNDWITPYQNVRGFLKYMTGQVFPNEIATSLRRNPDGSIRRINRWVGINARKLKGND